MSKNPLVSIIIPTKNSGKDLEKCLENLRNQDYKKIEFVITDGKSTDNTRTIAKKFKARILKNDKILAEPGVALGMKEAKGELFIVIATDNEFRDRNAISKLVEIFEDPDIYIAFPIHSSQKEDTLYTKYINTFTDPFSHFLYGYASNGRTFSKIYKKIKGNKNFAVYDFTSSNIKPVLGLAQGITVRKEFGLKRKDELDDFLPILSAIDEKKEIAFVPSVVLYHHTIRGLGHFIRKQRWATKNALEKMNYGINVRKVTLTKGQRIKQYMYPFYGVSIILPTIRAVYYAIKDREAIWLFHPIITFFSVLSIVSEFAIIKLGMMGNVSRQ